MIKPNFSHWSRWKDRHSLQDIGYPGVYALAVSSTDLYDTEFDWNKEIMYFGMTNSGGGLKSRLSQFDNTIKGKEGHGGGERFRFEYRNYEQLVKKLFVSVYPVKCDINSNKHEDLIKMGEVAYLEYYCFAEYVQLYRHLPKFNDKKNAPKLKADELKSANQQIQRTAYSRR
jgi:hypothetical protein